jgi:hypothetical protein
MQQLALSRRWLQATPAEARDPLRVGPSPFTDRLALEMGALVR